MKARAFQQGNITRQFARMCVFRRIVTLNDFGPTRHTYGPTRNVNCTLVDIVYIKYRQDHACDM